MGPSELVWLHLLVTWIFSSEQALLMVCHFQSCPRTFQILRQTSCSEVLQSCHLVWQLILDLEANSSGLLELLVNCSTAYPHTS